MKACTACGKAMATPLDEYGPIQAPVCANCWYRHGNKVERYVVSSQQLSLAEFIAQREVGGDQEGA